MSLPSELVSEFAKLTNDKTTSKEPTIYGTVSIQNGVTYVKLDGSDEQTPAIATVTVADGDRVIVTLRQHQVTITDNLTDPAASSLMVGEIGIKVDELGVKINGLVTFTNGLENGTTIIDGGCIKTDTLNLTGAISWGDLDTSMQNTINSVSSTANSASSTASTAMNWASNALNIASSINVPSYLQSTYIDSTTIKSPNIEGNNISVYGTFQVKGSVNGYVTSTGYMGAARGDQNGVTTYGVALASTWDPYSLQVSNSYLIVTDAGVRMQYGNNSLVVSELGAFYNGTRLDMLASSSTAVFA